jgi:hypothetical protein
MSGPHAFDHPFPDAELPVEGTAAVAAGALLKMWLTTITRSGTISAI